MKLIIFSQIVLSLMITTCLTAQLYEVPLDQKLQQSTAVIEGKVVNIKSYQGNDGKIYSANEIQVLSLFKGNLNAQTITIITYGGTIDGEKTTWTNLLKLSKEETGIFFIIPSNRPLPSDLTTAYEVYASKQGFLEYNINDAQEVIASAPFNHYSKSDLVQLVEEQTAQPTVIYSDSKINNNSELNNEKVGLASPNIDEFYPDTVRAGTGDVLTIIGSEFGVLRENSRVKFRSAHEGPSSSPPWIGALDSDYVLWSDSMIKVRVPSIGYTNNSNDIDGEVYAGTGDIRVIRTSSSYGTSDEILHVKFCATNRLHPTNLASIPVYLGGSNGEGGYDLYYNSNFSSDSASVAAFERALIRWRCMTGINYRIAGNAPPANGCQISYQNLPVGTLTTLGQTEDIPTGNCLDTIQQAILFQRRPSFTMAFNNNSSVNWYTDTANIALGSGMYDLESISMHELGHSLLLKHSNNIDDLMYYKYGSTALPKRNPLPNDLEGVNYIKNLSVTQVPHIVGCVAPMAEIEQSSCEDIILPTNEVFIAELGLNVYPNPTGGILNIEYSDDFQQQKLQISIRNSLGQILETTTATSSNKTLNLSTYSPGIYFLTISYSGDLKTFKVIKNR